MSVAPRAQTRDEALQLATARSSPSASPVPALSQLNASVRQSPALVSREVRVKRLDIFGHPFFVEPTATGWEIFHPGAEGKRGPPLALPIPHFVRTDEELAAYLADLCHEWATPAHPDVRWAE